MGYPDLKSDESIILTAQHVKVKSVPFELVLTNRRLIIIDSEKNVVPTQQIPLITIRNVATGENAIRDPVITLTILTDTADTRELALTFALQTAGERKREAGEWVKALKKQISEAISYPVEMVPDAQISGETHQEHTGTPRCKKGDRDFPPHKKDCGGHQPPASETCRDHVASRGIFLRPVREPHPPGIDILQPVRDQGCHPGRRGGSLRNPRADCHGPGGCIWIG